MHASNDDGKIAERIAGMAPVRLPDSLPGENGAEGFRDFAECRTVPQRVVVRAAQLIGSIVFRQFGNRCSVYGDLLRAFQKRVQRRRINGMIPSREWPGVARTRSVLPPRSKRSPS